MVYRRRAYRKKRMNKKRTYRRYTRRSRINRSIGNPNQKVFFFKRTADFGTINVTAANTTVYGASVFTFADIPSFADISSLFDFYKINAVKVSFIPVANVTQQTGNAATTVANTIYNNRIFSCIDYNDAGIPTSIDQIREYYNCKWSPNNVIHKRYFKPVPLMDTPLANEPLQVNKNVWIPTTNDLVAHYGIKYAIENTAGAVGLQLYKMEVKFYISAKSPH